MNIKVYFLICPLKNDVVYVGVTARDLSVRLKQHFSDYKNKEKQEWLKNLKKIGFSPIIKEINCFSDEKRAFTAEKFYIKLFGRKMFNEGKLLNITKGGTGGFSKFGRKLTKKQKLHLSMLQKEKFKNGTLKIPSRKGVKLTEEEINRLREINTGRKKTKSNLQKLSDANSVECVYQIDSIGNIIAKFKGMRQAAREGGFLYVLVRRSCSKPYKKTHKGFFFVKESNLKKTKND